MKTWEVAISWVCVYLRSEALALNGDDDGKADDDDDHEGYDENDVDDDVDVGDIDENDDHDDHQVPLRSGQGP